MPRTLGEVVRDMRRLVAFTNQEFADLQGVSLRTVERSVKSHGIATGEGVQKLIIAGYKKSPELARELAQVSGKSLVALGLEAPPPAPKPAPVSVPAPPPAPPMPRAKQEHADSVLLAAADALSLPPEQVRTAVSAAFARAAEMGMDPCGFAQHLPKSKAASKAPRS